MDPGRLATNLPGTAESVGLARAFVGAALAHLGVTQQRADDALLMLSEAATNAVTHTASGHAGGTYDVRVSQREENVRIEVQDGGAPTSPRSGTADDTSEHGRGIALITNLADRWAFEQHPDSTVVWFEVASGPLVDVH